MNEQSKNELETFLQSADEVFRFSYDEDTVWFKKDGECYRAETYDGLVWYTDTVPFIGW